MKQRPGNQQDEKIFKYSFGEDTSLGNGRREGVARLQAKPIVDGGKVWWRSDH